MARTEYDAVILGSGPNGLAAAILLARAGLSVRVLEGQAEPGGAVRSAALTLPGFVHDLGSAIHPMAAASPFFRTLELERHGLEWVHPEIPVAHPLEGGHAALLLRSLEATAEGLGGDAAAYRSLMGPLAAYWDELAPEVLQPMLHWPRHPFALARFGLRALWPASSLAAFRFREEPARALFAGLAAHSCEPLSAPASAAIGLVLGAIGHAAGWPFPKGGAQALSRALVSCLREAGGEIELNATVRNLSELPPARATLLDVTAWQFTQLAGDRLPPGYRRRLRRFRHGPGIFKLDYALDGPVPWQAEACSRAGTVHVAGDAAEVVLSESLVARGRVPDRPFVLVAQHSPFDPTRAPAGRQTLWAYCHIPFDSGVDMTGHIEAQIERFAPGFRERILARHKMGPAQLEAWNPNLAGGDIGGGATNLLQLLARPVFSANPYRTPLPGVYLCSSSTPPGGGVHGMCGFHAAGAALREIFGVGR